MAKYGVENKMLCFCKLSLMTKMSILLSQVGLVTNRGNTLSYKIFSILPNNRKYKWEENDFYSTKQQKMLEENHFPWENIFHGK